MRQKNELITSIRSKGISSGIPHVIMEALCRLLYDFVHGLHPQIPEHPSIATAVRSQIDIGIRLLPRGFVSVEWLRAMEDFGVDRPAQKFSKILKLIWFEFTDKLWRNRNEIAHSTESRTRQQEQNTWAAKLRWYLENSHVISPLDQFVFSYTEDGIDAMPGATRRRLVQNLERLERAYATELKMRARGQGTLRSYFGVRVAAAGIAADPADNGMAGEETVHDGDVE